MASLSCGCGIGANDVKCPWHAKQVPPPTTILIHPPLTVAQGWQCPVCGTVYAPTVPSCQNAHQPPPKATTGANDG